MVVELTHKTFISIDLSRLETICGLGRDVEFECSRLAQFVFRHLLSSYRPGPLLISRIGLETAEEDIVKVLEAVG
jgi:hypothetical protein